MLRMAFLSTSMFLIPTLTLAQSAVDLEALRKADALMEKVRVADSTQLLDFVAEFEPLVKTDGLSAACQTAIASMQALASTTVTADAAAEVPEEMREGLDAARQAAEEKLQIERQACLTSSETDDTGAETDDPANAQEQEETSARSALMGIRDQSLAAFEAKEKATLGALDAVLAGMGKDQNLELNCRLAATALARQIKQYGKALDAKDADMRKIAMVGAEIAGTAFDSNIEQCE
jgi:hypothetical protein